MATTSVIQMTADLTASTASGAVSQLLPSGTVLPFAGVNVPAGWLLCQGQEISKATYSSLWEALNTNGISPYDTQIDPTTGNAYLAPAAGNFRVPDYRGSFLRGVGTATGGDATTIGGHQGQKTAKNGLSSSVTVSGLKNQMNGGTGTVSSDHQHQIPMGDVDDKNFSHGGGQNATADGPGTYWTGSYTGGITANHTHGWDFGNTAAFSASGSPSISGDNETRPTNKGINYIIKV